MEYSYTEMKTLFHYLKNGIAYENFPNSEKPAIDKHSHSMH